MSTTVISNGTQIIVDETVVIKQPDGSGGGTPGSKTFKGTAIPLNTLGVDGDTYMRSNGDVYDKIAGAWVIQFNIKGPTGDTGATGATGATGSQGATGATGGAGAAGADGKSAYQSWLDLGNTGTEAQFIAALKGATGNIGATGATGNTGATGTAGTNGATMLSGTGAPTSQGVNGDFYNDVTNSVMYGPKASGTWPGGVSYKGPQGIQGTTGTTGTAGTNGNTVLTTSGQPANGTGVNGDFAYDPTAKIMYGPKTGGAWSAGTSLQGPQGTTGTTGTAGRSIQVFTSAPSGSFGTNYFSGDVVML